MYKAFLIKYGEIGTKGRRTEEYMLREQVSSMMRMP